MRPAAGPLAVVDETFGCWVDPAGVPLRNPGRL